MTPFLGSSAAPETHLFTPSVSSYAFYFLFFEKLSNLGPFLSNFGKILGLTHTNFGKNLFPKP